MDLVGREKQRVCHMAHMGCKYTYLVPIAPKPKLYEVFLTLFCSSGRGRSLDGKAPPLNLQIFSAQESLPRM